MPAAAQPTGTLRSPAVVVPALTLAVFALVVAFVSWHLRSGLREQILAHEGDWLANVAALQYAAEAEQAGDGDSPGALIAAAVRTSKMKDAVMVRVFDPERRLLISIPHGSESAPDDMDWLAVRGGKPRVRLHARESLAFLVGDSAAAAGVEVPVIEVWVPLRRAEAAPLAGAAQLWIDGRAVVEEFSALDRRLAAQATMAWLAGSAAIGAALVWALRRLAVANRELAARSEDLERANRELVLAAKTSALGAVTAHLIHEIKNPVAGLESFVASQTDASNPREAGAELAAASELTRRLRTMINDVVAVLRDEQHATHFELTCAEIAELAIGKARAVADRRQVKLVAGDTHVAVLTGRRANLATLVLQNLLQIAAEASPAGARVRLGSRAAASAQVEFLVEDDGPGLPEAVRVRLFQPCTSSKPGGSGLGLALSHHLAQQAGGRLELLRSDNRGTCFRLVLPLER